jgi:hypothetical protein
MRWSVSGLCGFHAHTAAFSRRKVRPSCAPDDPLQEEGAGNAGCWPQPMARLQQETQAAVTTGSAETSRHSLRDGFNAYGVLSRVNGLFCHPRLADSSSTRFDPSVAGSGPHAFAVRNGAARLATPSRPSLPRLTFVTIAIRPSCRGGMRHIYTYSEKKKEENSDLADRMIPTRSNRLRTFRSGAADFRHGKPRQRYDGGRTRPIFARRANRFRGREAKA